MLRSFLKPILFSFVLTAPAMAQTVRMEEAHVHGHGSVSVAVDGSTLTLVLESPAYDVLGFEHAASTTADKRLVAAVRSLLERPATLFELPSEAQCKLVNGEIAIGPEARSAHNQGAAGEVHSDIEAEYRFDCRASARIARIGFPWFEAFPLSQELDVVVLNDSGQHTGSVSPDEPEFRIR